MWRYRITSARRRDKAYGFRFAVAESISSMWRNSRRSCCCCSQLLNTMFSLFFSLSFSLFLPSLPVRTPCLAACIYVLGIFRTSPNIHFVPFFFYFFSAFIFQSSQFLAVYYISKLLLHYPCEQMWHEVCFCFFFHFTLLNFYLLQELKRCPYFGALSLLLTSQSRHLFIDSINFADLKEISHDGGFLSLRAQVWDSFIFIVHILVWSERFWEIDW